MNRPIRATAALLLASVISAGCATTDEAARPAPPPVAESTPAPEPVRPDPVIVASASTAPPAVLPKTASALPALGMLGGALFGSGLLVRRVRLG
jgi:hypothetical protein